MGKEQASSRYEVVVAGDVTFDWSLAHFGEGPDGSTCTSFQPGGAALLGELITKVADSEMSRGEGEQPRRAGTRFRVSAPEVPPGVCPTDDRLHHRFAVWTRYAEDDKQVWRVSQHLGLDRAVCDSADTRAKDDPAKADLVVLHDGGLGFRDQQDRWPRALEGFDADRSWILLRMAKPVTEGALWQQLQRYAERMIVVIHIDDLRLGPVHVSRELSWERTAQDLLSELLYNEAVNQLAKCAHVVVSFTTAGAMVLSRATETQAAPRCSLIFDPKAMERMWNEEHPGDMIGGLSALTAAIARQVMSNPQDPDLMQGVQSGIAAMRALDLYGYTAQEVPDAAPHLTFPTERMVQEFEKGQHALAQASVPDPSMSPKVAQNGPGGGRDWTILGDRYSGGLEDLAKKIVLKGPDKVLHDVTIGRFGKLLTVDRNEIEGFRSVRALVREYDNQTEHPRPLCIAVFGPPGAGKSFGVKQVAKAILHDRIEDITFNLSQFDDPHELIDALHRVRDISLGGHLPLVFWDEFDTTRVTSGVQQELGWLSHFLSPMQDGTFQDGQLTHPIGPAVFVFAGGTKDRMRDFTAPDIDKFPHAREEFVKAKGPDFVSRLNGYVDVWGPNHSEDTERSDPHHLIRRAVLLQSLLYRTVPQIFRRQGDCEGPDIDDGVLRAMLLTKKYRHGARSMQSIIAVSTLSGMNRFERSALPSEDQLDLHVDAHNFLDLVHHLDLKVDIPDDNGSDGPSTGKDADGLGNGQARRESDHDLPAGKPHSEEAADRTKNQGESNPPVS